MRRMLVWTGLLLCLVLGAMVCHARDAGDEDDEAKIKSAFLLNFIRYTTWPSETFHDESSPIIITVINRPPLLPYLTAIVQDEKVNGRPIQVRSIYFPLIDPKDPNGPQRLTAFYEVLRRSHMVFLPDNAADRMIEVLSRLQDADVLLVSDATSFVDTGGMLELRRLRNRIVFDANLDAIDARRVAVSSKVLKLAHSVKRKSEG